MKKLFLMTALMTAGMFAATRNAPAQTSTTAAITADDSAQAAADGDEARKACPVYAPKCCDPLPSGCINCVGMFEECP